jgi:hypothetical protein
LGLLLTIQCFWQNNEIGIEKKWLGSHVFYNIVNNKIIHKIRQTQHWKPMMFTQFVGRNFKDGTKKLHLSPTRLTTQILSTTWHELSFMLNFMLVHCPYKLVFCFLTSTFAPSSFLLAYHYVRILIIMTSFRNFINFLSCVALQPLVFHHL